MLEIGSHEYHGYTLVCVNADQVLIHEGVGSTPPRGRMVHACTGVKTACDYVDNLQVAAPRITKLPTRSPEQLSPEDDQLLTTLLVKYGIVSVVAQVARYSRVLLGTYALRDFRRPEDAQLVEKLYRNEQDLTAVIARG